MKNGPYTLVKAPLEYPGKTYRGDRRYVYEHHLVWWTNTKEVVGSGFDIHHKNEDKRDNRFENLEKKSHGAHAAGHGLERGTPEQVVCGHCDKSFVIEGRAFRWKTKVGQQAFYCSRSCQVKIQWIGRRTIPGNANR